MVAQLLSMSSKACLDIQKSVPLLVTRVKYIYKEDWVNLKKVLKYFKGVRELKLTLRVSDISVVKWWVDALNVVHEYCWVHMGHIMSLEKIQCKKSPHTKI